MKLVVTTSRNWGEWLRMVQRYFPYADREDADGILWHCTPFPSFGTDERGFIETEKRVEEVAMRSGQNHEFAMRLSTYYTDLAFRHKPKWRITDLYEHHPWD